MQEIRLYRDTLYIKSGEESYISIKRKFIKHVPSPHTECQDLASYSSDLYDFIIKSNRTYRQKDCFDLCMQQLVIEKCGCYFTAFDNPNIFQNQTRPCLTVNDSFCMSNPVYQFDTVKCASEYCPLECEFFEYDLTISSIISPTLNDYNSLNTSKPYEEWRTQFANIIIYFPQLEYTLIEETPAMTFSSLIANIGGSMGLIVSVSFFTLLEIMELFGLLLQAFLSKLIFSNVKI